MALPPIGDLVRAVRAAGPAALDMFAPEIDELADVRQLAGWLGIQPETIYRERQRARVDRPAWPAPARIIGRSPVWTYRTIVIHRADMPGPGNRVPRKPAEPR